MAANKTPNLYELTGDGLTVTYSTTSVDGKPRLTFKKGRKTLSFVGAEITSLDTNIGTLVSVVTASAPDKGSTLFSMLLPSILVTGSKKVSFRTVGITTVTTTTLAGPAVGAHAAYTSVPLKGSARQVDF